MRQRSLAPWLGKPLTLLATLCRSASHSGSRYTGLTRDVQHVGMRNMAARPCARLTHTKGSVQPMLEPERVRWSSKWLISFDYWHDPPVGLDQAIANDDPHVQQVGRANNRTFAPRHANPNLLLTT
jgi:hypothetical protein